MREITPKHLTCGIGMCPALFDLGDGRVAIIGTTPNDGELPEKIKKKVGKQESVVILPSDYLKGLEQ